MAASQEAEGVVMSRGGFVLGKRRKVGERRSAQRLKRVIADTTPKHLEQLTKQARALAGDDGDSDLHGSSMETVRARLGSLQQRHATLREKLTSAIRPGKALGVIMQSEFEEGEIEVIPLEGEAWNDSVLAELQERIHGSKACSSGQQDEEGEGQPESTQKQGEGLGAMYQPPGKFIWGFRGGRICIRFDTTFGEEKYESYYCVLVSHSPTANCIWASTQFPSFCHSERLRRHILPRVPDCSLTVWVMYYKHMFQGVNKQLKETKSGHIGELYHSLSYSLIEILLKEPNCQVGVSLAYHSLESALPTECNVIAWPFSPKPPARTATKRGGRAAAARITAYHLPRAESSLRSIPLPQAYEEILIDLGATLGQPPAPPGDSTESMALVLLPQVDE